MSIGRNYVGVESVTGTERLNEREQERERHDEVGSGVRKRKTRSATFDWSPQPCLHAQSENCSGSSRASKR